MTSNWEDSSQVELENDIVTVTKLQVALRATANTVPTQLSDLAVRADTSTAEGVFTLFQQAVALLLDQSQHWTHALAHSQTIDTRDAAEEVFSQLSLQERRKFSAETLTNVDGVLSRQTIAPPAADEKPAYIVVTLLLGTADDAPILGEIQTAAELRAALMRLSAIQAPYLLVFELLWSPQADTDVLTADDLASEYSDLIAIA